MRKISRNCVSLLGSLAFLVIGVPALGDGDKSEHHHGEHQDHAPSAMPEHHSHDMHWVAPKEAADRANPVAATPESIAQGRGVFESNCVACHGPNGNGNGP
ncbi:MAG: c-type cytochrome, partial [Gammaproteobacteria bacterium]|nr:c-type cytochrome [Gammaproteobacteria bacterium]